MILTVGGDAASKGAQEVMQALAIIDTKAPDWKYVCKVWPQPRTKLQNLADLELQVETVKYFKDIESIASDKMLY